MAIDFNTKIGKLKVNSEAAYVTLDVPASVMPFYGNRQWGAYIEAIYPVLKRSIFGYPNTVFNVCLRFENADYNVGRFKETADNIYDDIKTIVPGFSIRPSANTVIRANYRYHWERDMLGNPTVHTAGFQFGIASYF